MTTRTKKKFDCVETVRKERSKIAKEPEDMSPEEILEYFREKKKKGK